MEKRLFMCYNIYNLSQRMMFMKKILFLCHGNICRSPMAEFIFKDLVRKAGAADRFCIASAAVSREEEGNPIYPPARRELEKHGVPYTPRYARLITRRDYEYYDHIYYMDSRNARYLKLLFPGDKGKLQPLLQRDVADPYYTGDFTQTWLDITEGCERILKELLA